MKRVFLGFVAVVVLLVAGIPSQAQASDWMWSVTPYFWLSDMNMNVKINDREVIDERIEVRDVIDKVDFIFAAHLEGQRGKHGFFGDVFFADLADDEKARESGGPDCGELVTRGDFEYAALKFGF